MASISLSASKLDDFLGPDDGCERQWWMKHHYPYSPPDKTPIGVVGHAVLDRWMRTDDRGVDPDTGRAVDLYPKHWEQAVDRWGNYEGSISPVECEVIQNLVTAATTKGDVKRVPGRKVEEKFTLQFTSPHGNHVSIVGYRDVTVHPSGDGKSAEVWDHKFHGKMKRAKSPKKLYVLPQMRLYALDLFEKYPTLERVLLRHVVYCTDPTDARVRTVDAVNPDTGDGFITRPEIMEFKQAMLGAADRMVLYRDTAKGHHEVPITSKGGWVCMNCPFMRPCANIETIDDYCRRMDKWAVDEGIELRNNKSQRRPPGMSDPLGIVPAPQQEPHAVQNKEPETMAGPMSSFASLMRATQTAPAAQQVAPAPVAAPQPAMNFAPAPTPPVPVVPQPAPAPQVTGFLPNNGNPPASTNAPPWTVSALQNPNMKVKPCGGCKATPGFNLKGMPCTICVAFSAPDQRPEHYEIAHTPGGIIWERRGTDAASAAGLTDANLAALTSGAAPLPVQPAPATVETRTAPPAPVVPQVTIQSPAPPAAVIPPAPVAAPQIVDPTQTPEGTPSAEQTAAVEAKKKGGRPKGSVNKPKGEAPAAPTVTLEQATTANYAPVNAGGFAASVSEATKDMKVTGKGFMLMTNSFIQGPPPEGFEFVTIGEIFGTFSGGLADHAKVLHYFHLDTWKRREALAGAIPGLLPLLDGKVIVGKVDDPELRAFVTALRSHAKFSSEGFSVGG